MAKVVTTICIDTEVLERAKELAMNISGECNDYLKQRVNQMETNTDVTDILVSAQELLIKQKQLSKLQAEVKTINQNIDNYENKQEQVDLERLKAENEALIKARRCGICGLPMENPALEMRVKEGLYVHKHCWLNLPADRYKELMNK